MFTLTQTHTQSHTQTHTHTHNIYVGMLSRFSHDQLFATIWTVAHQTPLSIWFSKQEYCSGLSCPSSGDLLDLGIEPMTLMSSSLLHWQSGSLPQAPPGKPIYIYICVCVCVCVYVNIYIYIYLHIYTHEEASSFPLFYSWFR